MTFIRRVGILTHTLKMTVLTEMQRLLTISILALLLYSSLPEAVRAQDSTHSVWPMQALQGDLVLFALNTPFSSWNASVEINFKKSFHDDGSYSLLGCQLGIAQFAWPNLYVSGKYASSHGYRAYDYDILFRYTSYHSFYHTDLLAGLTFRDGDYYIDAADRERGSWKYRELRLSPGLKLGGALTIMLLSPTLGLRVKASCFFFGYKPIEAGPFGVGLVFGWQRPEDQN